MLRAALDLADDWLNLSRVELHVYTDNAAAIALHEKLGIEGTHRRFALRNGRYVDAYSMARVRGRGQTSVPGALSEPMGNRTRRGMAEVSRSVR